MTQSSTITRGAILRRAYTDDFGETFEQATAIGAPIGASVQVKDAEGHYHTWTVAEVTVITRIAGQHCQQCGSTDQADLDTGSDPEYQGYTRCCNERSVWGCTPDDCYHD